MAPTNPNDLMSVTKFGKPAYKDNLLRTDAVVSSLLHKVMNGSAIRVDKSRCYVPLPIRRSIITCRVTRQMGSTAGRVPEVRRAASRRRTGGCSIVSKCDTCAPDGCRVDRYAGWEIDDEFAELGLGAEISLQCVACTNPCVMLVRQHK